MKSMGDRCILHHANRKHEAKYYAASSATSEAMLIRELLLFTGLEVRTELLLDSAAARGICRHEGVGTTSCTSAENRADFGDKAIACPQTATAEAVERLGLDLHESLVTGDRRTRRSCITNNLRSWARRRRSLGRTREPGEGYSWDAVSVWSDARCNATSG